MPTGSRRSQSRGAGCEVPGWGHQLGVERVLTEMSAVGILATELGDPGITAIVSGLQAHGYDGWYVMEQDTILETEPAAGEGPSHDVRVSLAFLAGIPA